MNNPLGMIFQIMRCGENPQAMLKQTLGNNQIISNPIMKNALEMAQNGNMKGVEKLARNLCKEKGIEADEFFSKIKQNIEN